MPAAVSTWERLLNWARGRGEPVPHSHAEPHRRPPGLFPDKDSICAGCQYSAGSVAEAEGPVWCVVANIREVVRLGPGGLLSRRGHRLFSPGTKMHLVPPRWDVRQGNFEVLGLHRKTRRPIVAVLNRRYLTNFRAKLIYGPSLQESLRYNILGYSWSKDFAEAVAEHERSLGGDAPPESGEERSD